jgi:hypothetical protein
MPRYDNTLFVEIVIGEGVNDLGIEEEDGDVFQHLMGINGKRVTICITEEYTLPVTQHMWLDQLGLATLIPILFPHDNNNDNKADQ